MKNSAENKLDNPTWNSLVESHSEFALDYGNTKFYNPEYCPFGGSVAIETTKDAVEKYVSLSQNFFIVGEKPEIPDSLTITNELVCLQMVITQKIELPITEKITQLTESHNDALCELVNLVQPGYFKKKTYLLGDYFGIYKDNQLIAVTGERMRMNDFTEVSAIVTHPDHTGKGYAKQLITHVVNKNFDNNITPYLHVSEKNLGAIALYEKLGFVTRRKMSLWNIVPKK